MTDIETLAAFPFLSMGDYDPYAKMEPVVCQRCEGGFFESPADHMESRHEAILVGDEAA